MSTEMRQQEQLNDLTTALVESYRDYATINHLRKCPLPSSEAVIEIADDLKELLYPGYRRRQNLHFGNVAFYVGDLVDSLHARLSVQIAHALRHDSDRQLGVLCSEPYDADFESLGREKAAEFLESLPRIRSWLAKDVQAAYDGDPAASSLDEIIFCYPGLEAVTIYRVAHELNRIGVPLIPRILSEYAHSRTGIDIHPGASIGPSFFIDHGTGVVIGETTEIASGVKIYQGVTLGALSFPKDENGQLIRDQKRHPTIEDGVVIYANATVLGGKTVVGAGSVIGASVSLNRSVPANTVVTIEKPSLRFCEAS